MSRKANRPKRGLVVCAAKSEDGTIRITLDDVVRKNDDASLWGVDCFVTSKDYDEKCFDELSFDDKELADFGYYILSRLYSFKQRGDL